MRESLSFQAATFMKLVVAKTHKIEAPVFYDLLQKIFQRGYFPYFWKKHHFRYEVVKSTSCKSVDVIVLIGTKLQCFNIVDLNLMIGKLHKNKRL